MAVFLLTDSLFASPFLCQSLTEKRYYRKQDEEVSRLNLTKWRKSKKKKTPDWIVWLGLPNPHVTYEIVFIKR